MRSILLYRYTTVYPFYLLTGFHFFPVSLLLFNIHTPDTLIGLLFGTQVWVSAPDQGTLIPVPSLLMKTWLFKSQRTCDLRVPWFHLGKPDNQISLWVSNTTLSKRVRVQLDQATLKQKDQVNRFWKKITEQFLNLYPMTETEKPAKEIIISQSLFCKTRVPQDDTWCFVHRNKQKNRFLDYLNFRNAKLKLKKFKLLSCKTFHSL